MNTVREYRVPLLIGAGALIVALLLWAVLISPQSSKLSSLQSQQTSLRTQQSTLEIKLAALRSEKENLTQSCADLEKIATQIPTVQSPTDIDAEESSFESQFNGLMANTGVTLTQFSGFQPAATSSAAGATAATGAAAATETPAGVVAVPTTLAVKGNYSQMTAFINGLDSFPRLFVIQSFDLIYGTALGSTTGSTVGSGTSSTGPSAGAAAPSPTQTPLWVGGTPATPSSGPYSLSIVGSIYYTSTPNALDACTKATAAVH
jgi:Tfp pilus assembly protein PilO